MTQTFRVMDAMARRDALIKERTDYKHLSEQCPNEEWSSELSSKANSEELNDRIRAAEDHAKAMFESWLSNTNKP